MSTVLDNLLDSVDKDARAWAEEATGQKDDNGSKSVIDTLTLIKEVIASQPAQNITVNVPQQPPANVYVNVPEQRPPEVNVHAPVTVNMPTPEAKPDEEKEDATPEAQ